MAANDIDQTRPSAPPADHSELARTGLSSFFDRGIRSHDWRVFEAADNFRLAYVGVPTSNLAHLVRLRIIHESPGGGSVSRQHSTWSYNNPLLQSGQVGSWLQAPTSPTESRRTDCGTASGKHSWSLPLHLPYPQIRPSRSWRPDTQLLQQSSQNLITDLSSFPVEEVRHALLDAYFEHIHPSFPVITRAAFMHKSTRHPDLPPLLLYQSVLLAGAHVCTHPLVAADRQKVK